MTTKKWLLIGGVCILVAILAYVLLRPQGVFGLATSEFAVNASDVIGTKTGTTTAGVNFAVNAAVAGRSATSTYLIKTGWQVNEAMFTFGIKNASSTSNLHISLAVSNDDYCATATSTTPGMDWPARQEINWFDAAPFLDGHATQDFAVGTSTMVYTNPPAGTGKTLLLTNLNSECLQLQASGSSTVVWAQVKVK